MHHRGHGNPGDKYNKRRALLTIMEAGQRRIEADTKGASVPPPCELLWTRGTFKRRPRQPFTPYMLTSAGLKSASSLQMNDTRVYGERVTTLPCLSASVMLVISLLLGNIKRLAFAWASLQRELVLQRIIGTIFYFLFFFFTGLSFFTARAGSVRFYW